MFKKLQNLLFEDEEVIEEQDTDEEAEPAVKNKPHKQVKKQEPVQEEKPAEAKPAFQKPAEMPRIDVTQSLPKAESGKEQFTASGESVFKQTPVQKASPRPLPETKPEEEKKSFGITADDRPAVKKAEPAVQSDAKKNAKTKSTAYEFQPVISPIFGVDEKDIDAVKTTSRLMPKTSKKTDSNVSEVISPIYGPNRDSGPSTIQKTVEKSNHLERMNPDPVKEETEDSVPEFSLDDILKVRDEEYAQQAKENLSGSIFQNEDTDDDEQKDDPDQTFVINSRNLSLFDDDDDTQDQNTDQDKK